MQGQNFGGSSRSHQHLHEECEEAEEPIQYLASHGIPQEKGPNLSTAANSLKQKPEMVAIYFYFYFGFPKASVFPKAWWALVLK